MSLNKKIISLIKKKGETCNRESCTGGMSSAITSVSGSSKALTMA